MLNHIGDAAGTVGDIRHAVGPGLQKDQAEGIGPARQGEHVQAGEEILLLTFVEHAQAHGRR